jgi:hypothetical protein
MRSRELHAKKPEGKEEKASDDKDAESCISSFVIHFIDISWCFKEDGVSFCPFSALCKE